jgi:hypothetical protein
MPHRHMPLQILIAKTIEEKLSFITCFMQLQVSYVIKKCYMQLFFSCMQHV